MRDQVFDHEMRRRVLRLADRQGNVIRMRRRLQAALQLRQFFERVWTGSRSKSLIHLNQGKMRSDSIATAPRFGMNDSQAFTVAA